MIEVKSLDETFLERFDHEYNYEHFSAETLDFEKFAGPRVGDKLSNFPLYRLNGEELLLSELISEKTVVEFASYSCPNYRSHLQEMIELQETFKGAQFVVIYVREQHPGSNFYHHHSMSDKISSAVRLKEELGEIREVYCDDISGRFHRAAGGMPNSCLVLNEDLEVAYVANWIVPRHLQYILSGLVLDKTDRPRDGVVMPENIRRGVQLKTYLDCGWTSLSDVIVNAPEILRKKHRVKSVD